jgi:hypothetical protein
MPDIQTMYAKLGRPMAIVAQSEVNILINDMNKRLQELENEIKRLSVCGKETCGCSQGEVPESGVQSRPKQRTVRKRSSKKSGGDRVNTSS